MDISKFSQMTDPQIIREMSNIIGVPLLSIFFFASLIVSIIVGEMFVKKDKSKIRMMIVIIHLILAVILAILLINPYSFYEFFTKFLGISF